MKLPLLAALGLALLADTSPRKPGVIESAWTLDDWALATNDTLLFSQVEGPTVGLQIRGGGESALIRRRTFPLALPGRVTWKLRVTGKQFGGAYPSIHLVFDPPALNDPWWKAPIQPPAGGGSWAGDCQTFLFHFSTDPAWRRAGMTNNLEQGPDGHAYSPPLKEPIELRVVLERNHVTVLAGGKAVYDCAADLTRFRSFAPAFGDQTSTRVELDELRVEAGVR